ncbi:MAG TPA: DinB family protein [Leeuwenhoekiella sp.]|nr:DinB family protein [Leeuwenhoekiella sp.]
MEYTLGITLKNHEILTGYLEDYSLEELNAIPDDFNNNIFWNIAHTLAHQQMYMYVFSGETPLISEEWITNYKKGTKPNKNANSDDVAYLKSKLITSIEQTKVDYNNGVFKHYQSYTANSGSTLNTIEEAIVFNNFHEGIHHGAISALKRAIIARKEKGQPLLSGF